jgi:hypothetical protein
MRQVNDLNYTVWECKYHIVFIQFCSIVKAPGFAWGYLLSCLSNIFKYTVN